jgi:4-alpha-glucanotransferase
MNQRASGILLHPTSLPNAYPIGDLGPGANAFVDFMVESGQRWWQMLPIGPAGGENSPYSSPSAFAGNPLLLSPDRLIEQGFLNRHEVGLPASGNEGWVNYSLAIRLKEGWLRKAFENFDKNRQGGAKPDFEEFASVEDFWLDDFSLFSAIQDKEGTLDWTRWNPGLRDRQAESVIHAKNLFRGDMRYHKFVQWQFAVQWKELRAYSASRGVRLIGDIPLFVAHQSADVWVHPRLFKLDAEGSPTVVAGVPPDYFSPTGQLWGLPVYNWVALQTEGYQWWLERLRAAFDRFDVIRLDHFIGFVRTYEVSATAKTAMKGHYQPGGGAAFMEVVRNTFGSLPLFAEDLGSTSSDVVTLLDQFQIPGTRVLQFEFDSNIHAHSAPPALHTKKSVVYTGTHDNDTTAGWYRTLSGMQRIALQEKLGANSQEIVWAMIRDALASQTNPAIIPAQDLLELGSEARMNFPGIAKGNWAWRLKDGALTRELAHKMRGLTIECARLNTGEFIPASWNQDDETASRIAKRAYELYEQRGRQNGCAVQDWERALRELEMEGMRGKTM